MNEKDKDLLLDETEKRREEKERRDSRRVERGIGREGR